MFLTTDKALALLCTFNKLKDQGGADPKLITEKMAMIHTAFQFFLLFSLLFKKT